jgi:hypothetical protein
MAIAPCFDPTTGASGGSQGGGGGGGADLSALGFTAIDLTDSSTWTLTDPGPDSADPPEPLVDTVTHSDGVNTVVMNALGAGSSDYSWTSSTTQRAPRWTAPLYAQDASGNNVRVTSGDTFILQTVIEYVAPASSFATEIVVATAESGTATTSGTNKAQGGLMVITGSGAKRMGCFTGSSSDLKTGDSNNHQNIATANHSGGRSQAVCYVNVNSSGGQLTGGSRNSGMSFTNTTTDLNLMVGLGVFSSGTITAGDDAKIKAYYRVVSFNLPS